MEKENFDAKSEVDPTLARIVKQIQEKEGELRQLQNDSKFEPAVKARLLEEIEGEIKELSGQKMEALANVHRETSNGNSEQAESEIYDFPYEGKQRIGPDHTERPRG